MNKRTPPPKFENIVAGVKFQEIPGEGIQYGRSRLVASLYVASACWFVDAEVKKHPDALIHLQEKLRRHLLRQLFHDRRAEMADIMNEFFRNWGPIRGVTEALDVRDKLMELVAYTPPAGFDDDEVDCNYGENCGCEQFEFVLEPRPKQTS